MGLLLWGEILLKSVPDVVWSGIVGSLITVVGVLVTNVGLSRRHAQQLKHTADENALKREHEASESALDRKMKLKRDVYIPAIEALYTASSSIGTMADPTVSRSELQAKFVDSVGLISKVNAVASLKTIAAASTLVQLVMAVNFDLLAKRNVIEFAHGQMQANGQIVTRAVEDHARWVQTQTSMLFEGPPQAEKWNFVGNQIAFHQAQIDQWTAKQVASARELRIAQLTFLRAMVLSQPKLTEASITASIALRSELGMLDDDQDQLRKTLAENGEQARRALEEVILRVEQELGISRQDV